jgi:hypothetical protein
LITPIFATKNNPNKIDMKMKKVLMVIGLGLVASGMFAQGGSATTVTTNTTTTTVSNQPEPAPIVSKKGEIYLPQAGDWAIGMDATPWLSYFGTLLSGKGSSAATASFLNSDQTIVGKYYIDDHTAFRLLVRIGINSLSQSEYIPSSDTGTGFPRPQVEDKRTISSHFIGLGFGIERRIGKTRLQGYYGAEIMFYIAGSDTSFTYGNAYNSSTDPSPIWYDWYANNTLFSSLPRPIEESPGSTFGINALAYVGFEYFFLPKISIGGELTWGIGFQSTSVGSISVEELNSNTGADQTDIYKTGGSSSFSLDNGWNQAFGSGTATLNLTFHF